MSISRTVAMISLAGIVMIALFTALLIPSQTQTMAAEVDSSSNAETVVTTTAEKDSQQHKTKKAPESADDFYPVITERYSGPDITTVTNEIEASYTGGFDVKFPREMPPGNYKLQLGFVNHEFGNQNKNDNNHVFLFYSEKPITNKVTLNQFWEDGGISIIYRKNLTLVRNDVVGTENYGEYNAGFYNLTAMAEVTTEAGIPAREADVNGHFAVAVEQGYREFQGFDIHDPAQVDFIVGNTFVTIQGYKDTDELIRIAESMPFDAADDDDYNHHE